jgi:hypothetical protein
LMSESLYAMLSLPIRSCCRRVDRVTVKGSSQPISLYAFDVNQSSDVSDDVAALAPVPFFENTPPLFDFEYLKKFNAAVDNYVNGKWTDAARQLRECLEEHPTDVPASRLLEFMRESKFVAPKSWEGFRALTQK